VTTYPPADRDAGLTVPSPDDEPADGNLAGDVFAIPAHTSRLWSRKAQEMTRLKAGRHKVSRLVPRALIVLLQERAPCRSAALTGDGSRHRRIGRPYSTPCRSSDLTSPTLSEPVCASVGSKQTIATHTRRCRYDDGFTSISPLDAHARRVDESGSSSGPPERPGRRHAQRGRSQGTNHHHTQRSCRYSDAVDQHVADHTAMP
jgi:hypothetical protein